MALRARSCHVSLDYSDGLCTTHGSRSKGGNEVGLDMCGRRSSESTSPSVSQDLFLLGHGFMSKPESGGGSSWRRPCLKV